MKLTQPTEVYTYFTNLIKLVEKIVLSVSKSPIEDIETNTIIVNFLEKLANTYKCIKYFYLYKENFSPEILDSGLPIYYDYLGLSHADEQAKSIVSEILPKQQYIDIALKKLLSEHTKVDQQTMRGISKHFLLDALKKPRISISECELTESDSKVIISFSVISPLKQLPEFFIIHTTVNKPLTPEDKATIVNTINGTKEISDISVMMFTLDQKCASLKPTKAICFSMAGVYNQYCNTSNEALANSNAVHCIDRKSVV